MLKLVLAVGLGVVLFGRGASAQNVPFSMGPGGLHYGIGHFGPGVQFNGEHIFGTRGTGRFRARASADPHATLDRNRAPARGAAPSEPTTANAAPPAARARTTTTRPSTRPSAAEAPARRHSLEALFARRKSR